jgi:hypothetical protein
MTKGLLLPALGSSQRFRIRITTSSKTNLSSLHSLSMRTTSMIWWQIVRCLADPVLGQQDPSKFFLIQRMKSNPELKDCRQLPDWMKVDWNDPDDIEHPKKHRSQIRNRTSGSIAMHRPPWRERDLGEACGKGAQRMLALMEADIVTHVRVHFIKYMYTGVARRRILWWQFLRVLRCRTLLQWLLSL